VGAHELVSSNHPFRRIKLPKLEDTQKTAALGAKKASLALLAAAIGQIREGVVITDTNAVIQYVNPGFTRATGYSADEVIGQHTRLLKSDRQDPAYYTELWQTILAGDVWHGELLNRRKDGTIYTEEMSITPVRDSVGAITNFIAIKQDVSEHRATQAALHNSEKRLEDAQHLALLGSWELDAGATEFCGSAGFFHVFDRPFSSEALPFDQLMEAIAPADRDRISKILKGLVQTDEPIDVEHRVLRRDGAVRVVRTRGQVLTGQNGSSKRIAGTTLDITDGKLAHQKLQQSEEKFRSLVANIPDVTWSAAEDRCAHYISPNAEGVFGFTPDEICKQGSGLFSERIHTSDSPHIAKAFQQLFAQGQPFDVEYRLQRKDGQWIWVHDRAYRTYERDGVRYADGVFADITERKRAEDELYRSRQMLQTVLDAIPQRVFWKDRNSIYLGCNRALATDTGLKNPSEIIGKSDFDLAWSGVADLYRADDKRVMEQGSAMLHFEERQSRSDGSMWWLRTSKLPLRDREGKVTGIIGTYEDITERKRGEQALREAMEAAEAANRAKSQFLANMSHEIRTPMNGVIGVAGLLLDTALTAEQRQYAELVRISGEALMKVINDILDFSKIEARKLTLEVVDFDMSTVLKDAAAVLKIKASEKKLKLTCEIRPGTPRLLRGDPGRLRQILINLVGNAVKFTHQGEVSISAGLEGEDDGTATLRFAVSDTGIGFPQQQAVALFEPFVQADGSSTRRYGGTGLGLAISKQLVELMGGRIGAESQEGKGSTFWFTAVLNKQTAKQPDAQTGVIGRVITTAQPGDQRAAVPRTTRGARILLAEDNRVNQAVAQAMLIKLGYQADLVVNGVEALHALSSADYDLVLMDCGMPQMDGYEATRLIRDREVGTRNSLIPIIAITADAMTGDRDKCLDAGMSDYIAKPVELRKLAEILEKWLDPASTGELDSAAGPSAANAEPVFDLEDMLARLMDDKDLGAKVVAAFLDDAPQQLQILRKMLEEGDAEGARRQAHTLKGAAATMSAEPLRALCSEVQEAAAAGELRRALVLLPGLQEQFELLKTALKQSGLCS